jgi:hypothetical protein
MAINNIGYFMSKRNRFQPTIHSQRFGCQSTILDRGAAESYIEGMAENILTKILGSQRERDLKALGPLVRKTNALEPQMLALRSEEFQEKTVEYRKRYQDGVSLDSLLPETFALVREAARRTLGERIFDVQLMGGIVLHKGKIMEMKTGEGKTLSSVTAAYLNALPGKGVQVVTVNDYLAERDANWMGRIYNLLGISVGVVLALRDQQRVRLRLSAGQHALGCGQQSAARAQLLYRRRDRLHPDRRGPDPSDHIRSGGRRYGQLL